MFCTKCGAPMAEGQRFCSNCGAMVEAPAPAAEPARTYTPPFQQEGEPQPGRRGPENPKTKAPRIKPERPKKKAGWILPVVLGLVVLAAAACLVLFWNTVYGFAANLIDKTFSSTEEYYQHVEKKGIDKLLAATEDNTVTRGLDKGFYEEKVMLSFNEGAVNAALLDLIEDELGVDISWLENLGVYLSAGEEDGLVGGSMTLFLNDTDIIDADYVLDADSGNSYFRVPMLSSRYARVSGDQMSYSARSSFNAGLESAELLKDPELFRTLIDRYTEIVIGDLTKVEKERTELSAGGVSKTYDAYEVKIDGKVMLKIAKDVLKKLKNDAEFEDLFLAAAKAYGYSDSQANSYYDDFLDEINDALEDLENTDPSDIDRNILMTVYVDGQGNVVGRDVKVRKEKEVVGQFSYALVTKGTKFGAKVLFTEHEEWGSYINDQTYTLEGSGSGSLDGSISGSFDVRMKTVTSRSGSEDKLDLKLVKLGVNLSSKDNSLKLTVTPTKDLINYVVEESYNMPSAVEELLRSISAELSFKGGDSSASFSVMLKNGKKDMIGLSSELYQVEDYEVPLPASAADLDDWAGSIDYSALTEIVNRLKSAGMPASLLENIF